MNEWEFSSVRSNYSGKSSGMAGMIFLILFAMPFAGFGLLAFIQGFKKIIAGSTHDGVPLCIFGFIFSCIGFGLMAGSIFAWKKSRRTAELRARFADKPWMCRADWAEGKIKASTISQAVLFLIMGVAFSGIGGLCAVFSLPEVWQKHNSPALIVLVFPLAGIGFLFAFANAWLAQRRFGDCFFELAQVPVPLGGILEGMIQTGHPLKLEHELHLKFSCIRRVVTGVGKSRSTNEYVLWQNEKIYSEQANLTEPEPGHSGIPVHFKLPADQPECNSHGDESIIWRLEARSKMRGPAFHAVFDLPVFKVAGAAVVETDDADPTAAMQAPMEEIRRDENSKIKVSDGPNGREFYFPAARYPGMAFCFTIFFAVWSAIFYALLRGRAPLLFPIVWGLFDAVLAYSCFNQWFRSSRVTIDSTNVRATKRWLFFSRTRQFSANDVARFATGAGMRSGSQSFTDIKLIPRGSDEQFAAQKENFGRPQNITQLTMVQCRAAAGPSGVTVADNIASLAEADWLVAEMNRALGRKT